jgi:hypothetical protein
MCRNDSGQNTPVGGHLRSEYVSDRWVNIQESRKNNHTSKGVSLLRNGGVNLKRNRGVNMVRNLHLWRKLFIPPEAGGVRRAWNPSYPVCFLRPCQKMEKIFLQISLHSINRWRNRFWDAH